MKSDNRFGFVQGLDFFLKGLLPVNWGKYAKKIDLMTSEGFPKYQGFLFVGTDPLTLQRYAHTVGFLMDNKASAQILMRKFGALEKDTNLVASIQVRNVVRGDMGNAVFGGAVRSSNNVHIINGGTGLPETSENLSVAAYMHHTGQLTLGDYLTAVSYENVYIQQACKFVGISKAKYSRMRSFIEGAVSHH
jgi:hypothetical protein